MKAVCLLTILVFASPLWAAGGLSVDAKFDLTGDGIIDASDWARMNEDAKAAYARESLAAMGEDGSAIIETGVTRSERFLQGLRAVYE